MELKVDLGLRKRREKERKKKKKQQQRGGGLPENGGERKLGVVSDFWLVSVLLLPLLLSRLFLNCFSENDNSDL